MLLQTTRPPQNIVRILIGVHLLVEALLHPSILSHWIVCFHGQWILCIASAKEHQYSQNKKTAFVVSYSTLYLSSCQKTSNDSWRKGSKAAVKFCSSICADRSLSFSSRLFMKIEVTTWTMIEGSGSPKIACNSRCIHGSILCKICCFHPLFLEISCESKRINLNV